MNNTVIADQFSLLSKLMDINGENSFSSKTYSIAAFNIERLDKQLEDIGNDQLSKIPGFGYSVVSKIEEILTTGKLKILDEYVQKTPSGVLEMLQIKGLGPKKIHAIWKEMGIQSIGELEYACIENRLSSFKGFGQKTQQKILETIRFYKQNLGHFLYAQINEIFDSVFEYLKKIFGKEKVMITGDYRRQMPTIKELEFIIDEGCEAIKPKFQTAYPPELLEEREDSLLYKLSNGLRLRLYNNRTNIYKKQFLTSASDAFLEEFFLNENNNLFENEICNGEIDIFKNRGVPYIAPCLRESKSIIEKAKAGKLPELIRLNDIKGCIHNHSNWSDGINTIEELVNALIEKKFEYLVISDHSKTAAYANGLSEERILKQHVYIDELNKKYPSFKVFKSIESDILSDGSLDYAEDLLKTFDLVIASVHSNLYMDEEKAMMRLMKAIENPYTTILGHPTGRLLLSRKGYPINHKKIIDACAANQVVIEINANPHRLDMDWEWIDYAMNKNVMLSIDPDAHSIEGIDDIRFGVLAAQKGGLTPEFNLSSFSLKEFETFLTQQKTKR
jgi:DNA polymerase (family 10)